MNSPSEQDLQRQLDQIEEQINSTPVSMSQPHPVVPSSEPSPLPAQQPGLSQLMNWFNGLTKIGKLVVAVVGVLVGLSILQAVLKLVSAAISLALIAGLLYFGYKFFLERSSQSRN